MSIYRSIELRKNTSGSYKVRLTIDRGSKFCGARKSLGLGTHRGGLRPKTCLPDAMPLLFHMGWFPGGKIAVRNSAECGIKDVVWDSMECSEDSGMFKLAGRGGRMAADETMVSGSRRMKTGRSSASVCSFPDGGRMTGRMI